MAHKVFICHSSKDKFVADAACAALEAHRIPCWIAPRDILAGEEYGAALIDALDECQIVLLIFSLSANNSPQVRREIERAVSKEKILVPYRIEDVPPSGAMEFALMNTHWLDALTPPLKHRLPELCDTISRLIQKRTRAEPLWTRTADDSGAQKDAEQRAHESRTQGLPPSPQPAIDVPDPSAASLKNRRFIAFLVIFVLMMATVRFVVFGVRVQTGIDLYGNKHTADLTLFISILVSALFALTVFSFRD